MKTKSLWLAVSFVLISITGCGNHSSYNSYWGPSGGATTPPNIPKSITFDGRVYSVKHHAEVYKVGNKLGNAKSPQGDKYAVFAIPNQNQKKEIAIKIVGIADYFEADVT